MKILMNLNYGAQRRPARHCEHPGCNQSTREGKEFCSDHVEHHPYARRIIEQLAEREKEVASVKRRGKRAVPMSSEVTRDLLGYIVERGGCTVERLRRERMHDVDEAVVQKYVDAMEAGGLVVTSTTARGSTMVKATRATMEPIT